METLSNGSAQTVALQTCFRQGWSWTWRESSCASFPHAHLKALPKMRAALKHFPLSFSCEYSLYTVLCFQPELEIPGEAWEAKSLPRTVKFGILILTLFRQNLALRLLRWNCFQYCSGNWQLTVKRFNEHMWLVLNPPTQTGSLYHLLAAECWRVGGCVQGIRHVCTRCSSAP